MKKISILLALVVFCFACTTETPVAGELFIVTKGAGNYKLGAVTVAAFPKKEVMTRMEGFKDNILKEIESAKGRREVCLDAVRYGSDSQYLREANECYEREQASVLSSVDTAFGSGFQPKASATTNSDGKFTMKIPGKGEFILFARSQRTAGGSEEQYLFMKELQADGTQKDLVISNADLLTQETIQSKLFN